MNADLARLERHMTADGCAIIPPHIAYWLWKKSGLSPERRERIRDADPEAYAVLMALRTAAGNHVGSAGGTKAGVRQAVTEQSDVWMTTTEVAQVLGVSDRAVRKQITKGQLPAIKPGKCWLVNRNVLAAVKRRANCDAIA